MAIYSPIQGMFGRPSGPVKKTPMRTDTVANQFGTTKPTGGGGPTVPTYGQIFPSGR